MTRAGAARIFEALVDPALRGAHRGPAGGDSTEGAPFSAFGGHITGRHVELWESAWSGLARKALAGRTVPIVSFELHAEGAGASSSSITTGSADMKDHLAQGWQSNYWDKLATLR